MKKVKKLKLFLKVKKGLQLYLTSVQYQWSQGLSGERNETALLTAGLGKGLPPNTGRLPTGVMSTPLFLCSVLLDKSLLSGPPVAKSSVKYCNSFNPG